MGAAIQRRGGGICENSALSLGESLDSSNSLTCSAVTDATSGPDGRRNAYQIARPATSNKANPRIGKGIRSGRPLFFLFFARRRLYLLIGGSIGSGTLCRGGSWPATRSRPSSSSERARSRGRLGGRSPIVCEMRNSVRQFTQTRLRPANLSSRLSVAWHPGQAIRSDIGPFLPSRNRLIRTGPVSSIRMLISILFLGNAKAADTACRTHCRAARRTGPGPATHRARAEMNSPL